MRRKQKFNMFNFFDIIIILFQHYKKNRGGFIALKSMLQNPSLELTNCSAEKIDTKCSGYKKFFDTSSCPNGKYYHKCYKLKYF